MECPYCKVFNHPSVRRCECGHELPFADEGGRSLFAEREASEQAPAGKRGSRKKPGTSGWKPNPRLYDSETHEGLLKDLEASRDEDEPEDRPAPISSRTATTAGRTGMKWTAIGCGVAIAAVAGLILLVLVLSYPVHAIALVMVGGAAAAVAWFLYRTFAQ